MKIRMLILSSFLACSCAQALAENKTITINSTASYYDEKIISSNIKNECTDLGSNFSTSTKKNLESNGWTVLHSEDGNTTSEGVQLKLQIVNASSGGNAFMGHHKLVSVNAELYKDGQLVDTYTGERSSKGGFGAGFKGSCTVLERCTTTLGKDVAKWLKGKSL